jgi:hypothetical protein
MIIIPDKTGEVKLVLSHDRPSTSFTLTVSATDKYSVWTSAKNGTVRVFSEFDLHRPLAMGTQQVVHTLEPGNYFVALTGEPGNFTLNVTAVKHVTTPAPQKPAEAETHAEA